MMPGFAPSEFTTEDNGVVWMVSNGRLMRYDSAIKAAPPQPLRAIVTGVQISASGKYQHAPVGALADLPFTDNSLCIRFAAPANPFRETVSFEVQLHAEGERPASWTSTGTVGSASFNRLKEGTYVFRVRPVAGAVFGAEAGLTFRIRPPWYRSRLAYICYGLAACLGLTGIILLATMLQRRENRRLERLVGLRTAELRHSNSQLQDQIQETVRNATELAASQERLHALNSELEQRVANRTRELDSANRELHKANADLTIAKDLAECADRAKSAFLANMTHEIRTPLNGVIGMSHLLMGTQLSAVQKDFVETLLFSSDTLLSVINDVLDFSKIEAGRLVLEVVDFNLHEQLERCLDLQAASARKKRLELVLDYDQAVPRRLRGDPVRLRQIVLNLLGNAIKFTEQGGVVVRVVRQPESVNPCHLRIEVQDTGIGIPLSQQAGLFQRFVQADSSTTRRFGGTGLGLAICRRLTDLMNGRIGVLSTPGLGSIFRVDLPLESAAAQESAADLSVVSGNTTGRRILIVDDSAANRKYLFHTLAGWRFQPEVAADAGEALALMRLEAAAGSSFDLILLDYRMPETDGLELARQVRAQPELGRPRIILLTSEGEMPAAQVIQQAGIDAAEFKPVSEVRLRELILRASPPTASAAAGRNAIKDSGMDTPRPAVRVLVAEDNPVNQKVAMRFLRNIGIEPVLVGNGAEAIEALGRSRFDLVLMDVQMPVMDGLAATRAIRKAEAAGAPGFTQRVSIIAMTANALSGDREMCLAAGMDDYVTKPLTPESVGNVLERLV
jgi:signal transduction histidine kinase/DNA-binding response OmpR family regulator